MSPSSPLLPQNLPVLLGAAAMDLMEKPFNTNPSKRLKEEFVSNLTGSSMVEIAALSAIVPALVVLRQWTCSSGHFNSRQATTKKNDNVTACGNDWSGCTIALAMDFLYVILPVLLFFTVLADWAGICAVLLILVLLLCIVAKKKWKAAMKSICPLVVLGLVRLISTAGVDYQVHVGEYGVHWNFFFTLAAVSSLTSMVNIHPRYCGFFGSLILIGYQVCLISGLSDYLISNERTGHIVDQNKEGLFSVFGYWGLYLIGVHLGYHVFFANESSNRTGSSQRAMTKVWILAVLLWLLTIILDKHVERVSRRTCNLAYVTFVLAQNFEVLAILMLSDFISGQKPLVLEEAFNQNLLGSFLLANILTGMVNLSVDTLSSSSFTALGILVGYAFLLSAVVGVAFFYGIRFKFW